MNFSGNNEPIPEDYLPASVIWGNGEGKDIDVQLLQANQLVKKGKEHYTLAVISTRLGSLRELQQNLPKEITIVHFGNVARGMLDCQTEEFDCIIVAHDFKSDFTKGMHSLLAMLEAKPAATPIFAAGVPPEVKKLKAIRYLGVNGFISLPTTSKSLKKLLAAFYSRVSQ